MQRNIIDDNNTVCSCVQWRICNIYRLDERGKSAVELANSPIKVPMQRFRADDIEDRFFK